MQIAAFVLMCVLQVGDVITTTRFLAAGKREANPFMRRAMEVVGVGPAMVLKLIVTGLAAWGLCFRFQDYFWVMAPLCAIYAYVVWRNWRVVK